MNDNKIEQLDGVELFPHDQTDFINELIKLFQNTAEHEGPYFMRTIEFLKENWFLDPLVCSLRAVMNQGFLLFPEYANTDSDTKYKRDYYKNKTSDQQYLWEQFSQSFLSIIYAIISKTLEEKNQLSQKHDELISNMLVNENDLNKYNRKRVCQDTNRMSRNDQNTRSTEGNDIDDKISKLYQEQNQDLNSTARVIIPSSRAFTTRMNTLSSNNDNRTSHSSNLK